MRQQQQAPLDSAPMAKEDPAAEGGLAATSDVRRSGETDDFIIEADQKWNEEQRAGSGCRAVSSSNETFGPKVQ